jgi:hypothetical protein
MYFLQMYRLFKGYPKRKIPKNRGRLIPKAKDEEFLDLSFKKRFLCLMGADANV